MMDISKTIEPKSDQINADDLIGGPRTILITHVSADPSSAEQPVSIRFDGDNGKPYKPCKSMRRVLVHLWGKDGSTYVGKSMTIYRDQEVQFGGIKVGGIRISHMSGLQKAETMALTATRANRRPFTVHPLKVEPSLTDREIEAILDAAREQARAGSDAMRVWWKDNPEKAAVARSILAELKDLAEAADRDAAQVEADPFADADSAELTDDQRSELAAAEAAFRAGNDA